MSDPDFIKLRRAIELSWTKDTAYKYVFEEGNPSKGQCYVTSWLLQQFYPELEIYEGQVKTGVATEKHFWTVLKKNGNEFVIDLTWQQFPAGSEIISKKHRDRDTLDDTEETIKRREILLNRVNQILA